MVTAAVAALPRSHPTWVFSGRLNGHVHPATVWTWVVNLAEGAGIERVTTHRLRHTCLATANDNTGDLRAVQDFARHSKVDTTAGYTRSTERRLRTVMESIDYSPGAAEVAERGQRLAAKLKRLAPEHHPAVEALVDELLGESLAP